MKCQCAFLQHTKKNFLSRGAGEDKPKSKEDFQRLYAELESWRMKQEKKISDAVKPGSSPGRLYHFCDGAQSKSGKVAVLGETFAVHQLRKKLAITLLSVSLIIILLLVVDCHVQSFILNNGATRQTLQLAAIGPGSVRDFLLQ